jgi:hypothetical protein
VPFVDQAIDGGSAPRQIQLQASGQLGRKTFKIVERDARKAAGLDSGDL